MRLSDLKISTQLRLGLGTILLLVVTLAVLAWRQSDQLWLQTATIYEHPLQVRRAIGELKAEVLAMRVEFRNLLLFTSEEDRQSAIQASAVHEADAVRQFQVLFSQYLGPAKDVESAHNAFVRWVSMQNGNMALARAGKISEALDRTRAAGDMSGQTEELLGCIAKIDDFARNKAEELFRTATAQHRTLLVQLAAITAAILLLSVFIAWYLLKTINGPLRHLAITASQLRQGKMDTRSQLVSANEFGTLSASFNAMADSIQREMMIEQNAAELAHIMLGEDEVHAFCREMLKALLLHTGSQVGAVYFLNEARTDFEHFESIGLGAGGRTSFSATELEGELGAALATRKIQRITDIPADSQFAFHGVSGDFLPREILTIPVLSDHTMSAVISLASVRPYDAPSIRLVNDIWSVLTARVNGVLAFQKIQDLAQRLERQNHELDVQKQELSVQADELNRQNSELDMQKREVEEANRLKSAFLASMSHELRTPLNSVIALTGVLNRRLANAIPAEEHGYLEIIERNGKSLLSLINDLLDLSRIEAGREEVTFTSFSLHDLVGELAAMIGPQAQEKKIALVNEIPAGLPPLTSDHDKCRHILQNLIGNAVKFTERGRVTITAEFQGSMGVPPVCDTGSPGSDDQPPNGRDARSPCHLPFRISVKDTGIGIAADQLSHIFDEFRQADGSNTRKYGGTGLGLAIARKYALMLGGDITVESVLDKGSTFTLSLLVDLEGAAPSAPTSPSMDGTAQRPSLQNTSQGKRASAQTILIVEDNEPAILQLTHILRPEGYNIRVAHNGQEALDQLKQTLPDAMILDLMMPQMDGFQVLTAIHGEEQTARLPVIILTAKQVSKEEFNVLQANHVHQLIQKGDINKTELLAAVAAMVEPRAASPSPPPRHRRPARPGKPVVLVVEDNPDNLHSLKALLGDRYLVVEAGDGRAGIEQARRHLPDLVLTDIALPVLDGIHTLCEIREDKALQDIPVVAISASAMKGDREQILAHGFDGYLSKPIDHDALQNLLREFLGEAQ
ncbi:MAG: response regulator [Verrucomicrobia bacterium]|nr:response regulator [Verrucomicrobiota bacterium]